MNLLAITCHGDLVERLRLAFEEAGHEVRHIVDPLEALAQDAWTDVHALLVDTTGDPMDGFRLCRLLRGEARVLFRNLPIFLVTSQEPSEADRLSLRESEADGFLDARSTVQELQELLDPLLSDEPSQDSGLRLPVLATGLLDSQAQQAQSILQACGMEVHAAPRREAAKLQLTLRAPVVLLGLSAGGAKGAVAILTHLREADPGVYAILVGQVKEEAAQVELLQAGVADWLSLPLSAPRLLHACRKAIEWTHARRIQSEYRTALHNLRERKSTLEREAAALRDEVLTDALTGLHNRRAFDQNLENAMRQWERHRRGFVLVFADVDHFKRINDRYGHPVGDGVLRQLSACIRSALRKSDLAFRIGGDEFAILLSETSLRAGEAVADKLRARIDGEPIQLPGGQSIYPTMSFGVAGPGAPSAAALLSLVDQALYLAKSRGRNRVVVSRDGDDRASDPPA